MISETKFTVLGHVPDGDKNQVVVRLKTEYKGKPWETMIFRATKEFEGEHRLLITHEINTAADFMRENL